MYSVLPSASPGGGVHFPQMFGRSPVGETERSQRINLEQAYEYRNKDHVHGQKGEKGKKTSEERVKNKNDNPLQKTPSASCSSFQSDQ